MTPGSYDACNYLPEDVLLQLRTPVLIRGQRRSTETAFPLTRTNDMINDMNLGTTETFEVWFIPVNRTSYSPRLVTEADNLQEANDFVAERLPDMVGTLEIVRATLCRQRVA